jgi:thioesterase DpgC
MDALQIYDALTDGRRKFVRVDELCYRAAERFPGVLPSAADLAAEAPRLQKDKQGIEKAQGEFLSTVLRDPLCGTHLCHAMLLPHPGSQARLAEFESKGTLDLGGARVHREGKAAVVTMNNPRFLNAEDESTLEPLEIALDVALLDKKSDICVLRGATVTHTRHAGKRLFGALQVFQVQKAFRLEDQAHG